MGIKNELIAEIKDFLRVHKVAPTTFSRKCMNNTAFISRLTDPDSRVTDATIDRVRAYIKRYRRKMSIAAE
jgi:hypothetical protein